MPADAEPTIAAIYRNEWARVLAALIRMTGDFALAEDATQEAFEALLHKWEAGGLPEHPRAFWVQTARHLALDKIRRSKVLAGKLALLGTTAASSSPAEDPFAIPDDRLRLVFTCCHPALALEASVALTLRTLLGLETEAIARAFLVPTATMAQRLVRAKKKIADAGIPYVVPERSEMGERLHAVLTVLYLVFTEGYAATRGPSMLRLDLSTEAIRLARLVRDLLPTVDGRPPPEVTGLLALMLLHDARRHARVDAEGELVMLDEQDRSSWDHAQIAEALALLEPLPAPHGPFVLQAMLAAVHGRAVRKEDTDWPAIVRIYDALLVDQPSAIVRLNRAVAVAMVNGPAAGLALVDGLLREGLLADYHLLHAARADFARRLGARADAEASYTRALELVQNDAERRFLTRRLEAIRAESPGSAVSRPRLSE